MQGDNLHKLEARIEQLYRDVANARAEDRIAHGQANVARWCSTQLTLVLLDMLIKADAISPDGVRSHLDATLALLKPHRKQPGMQELAKQVELLLRRIGEGYSSPSTHRVPLN